MRYTIGYKIVLMRWNVSDLENDATQSRFLQLKRNYSFLE